MIGGKYINTDLMFSSKSDEWETPQDLFDKLNKVFNFTLDAACTHENAKCKKHFTIEEDTLKQSWKGENVYLNPPYGRKLPNFIKKSYEESKHANVVILIPSRTDTKAMHKYCFKYAKAICFIQGRLKFINRLLPSWNPEGNFEVSAAPFPSCIIVFAKDITEEQIKVLNSIGFTIINNKI